MTAAEIKELVRRVRWELDSGRNDFHCYEHTFGELCDAAERGVKLAEAVVAFRKASKPSEIHEGNAAITAFLKEYGINS